NGIVSEFDQPRFVRDLDRRHVTGPVGPKLGRIFGPRRYGTVYSGHIGGNRNKRKTRVEGEQGGNQQPAARIHGKGIREKWDHDNEFTSPPIEGAVRV